MKFRFALALVVLSLLSTVAAKASTYNVTLTNLGGGVVCNGQFDIAGSVSSTGFSNFVEGSNLNSLNFSIGGKNFTLSNDFLPAVVTFKNGDLFSIAYAGVLGSFQFSLDTIGLGYTYLANGFPSLGTISLASGGTSATPLPESWPLMLVGLIGLGFLAYRRQNGASFAAA